MEAEVLNKNKGSEFHGDYVGRDQIITNIILFQDNEREFVVTHNADIKPVSYFTGRETELQDLRQRIEEGRKSVLVSGMGGIGKTHICRKLFEEYLNEHADNQGNSLRHIGYIEYSVDIGSSLLSCLKYKKQKRVEDNQEAAWRELEYLASDGRLLLFVDNVNVSMGEDPGLKRLMGIPGAIVLTSRRRVFSKEFEPYRIGFLNAEKCREIYEKIRFEDSGKRIEQDEEPDLEYIINTLAARHTITVEFLAHLAWTKNWTVKKLRKELEDNGFQLEYRDEEDKLVNIQKSYETLYDLSVLTASEQNILEAFSMFPYIPLDVETCNLWLLEDAGVSEDDDILRGLYRKGWLQYNMEQEGYSLHPVFAQFIYIKCKPLTKKHIGLVKACQKCLCMSEIGSALPCKKYVPFIESFVEKWSIEPDIRQALVMFQLGYFFQYIANYKNAEKMYKKFIESYIDIFGECPSICVRAYHNLILVYIDQERYDEAEKLCKKTMHVFSNVLKEEKLEAAFLYKIHANIYRENEMYEEAEELYLKSLHIYENESGKDNLDLVSIYCSLYWMYKEWGKEKKVSELLCKRKFYTWGNLLGKNYLDTVSISYRLAKVYEDCGVYDKARKLYYESLRGFKKTLGSNHPQVALVYSGLAQVYAKQGNCDKAEEFYNKTLSFSERVLEKNDQLIAKCYNDLGYVHYLRGEPNASLKYYFKAYKILKQNHEKENNNMKICYNNMKLAYKEWNPKGDFEQWLKDRMEE